MSDSDAYFVVVDVVVVSLDIVVVIVILSVIVNATAGTTAILDYTGPMGDQTAVITVADSELPFVRGDTNSDANCDITDAVDLLEILFQGGENNCHDAGDIDDNGSLEITDVVVLLTALFQGGPAIDESCGPDSTTDALPDCLASACP